MPQLECLRCETFFPRIGPRNRQEWKGELRLCQDCLAVLAASPYIGAMGPHHVAENNGLGQFKGQFPADNKRFLGQTVGKDNVKLASFT